MGAGHRFAVRLRSFGDRRHRLRQRAQSAQRELRPSSRPTWRSTRVTWYPLFNLDGEVAGINSQIFTCSGGFMGCPFAIPIDVAMDVANQRKSGQGQPWLAGCG